MVQKGFVFALVTAAMAFSSVSYANEASSDADQGLKSLQRCNELRAHSSVKAALGACKRAYAESVRFDTASALGFVYLKMGDRDKAVKHLATAAERMPADINPTVAAQFRRRFDELGIDAEGGGSSAGPAKGWVVAGGVTSLLGLSAGTALLVTAAARGRNVSERQSVVDGAGQACGSASGVYGSICEEIDRNQKAQTNLTIAGGVLVGAAGAAAVSTIIYAVVGRSSASASLKRNPPIAPVFIGGRPAGAELRIRF